MKQEFNFNLDAKRFFPLFIAFFIPWVILEVLIVFQSRRADTLFEETPVMAVVFLLLVVAMFLLIVLLYIPIFRKLISAISLNNEPFHFNGAVGKFLGLNLLGIFLTGITAGVYGPWYITRISRYLVGEISYKEARLEFAGKGGPFVRDHPYHHRASPYPAGCRSGPTQRARSRLRDDRESFPGIHVESPCTTHILELLFRLPLRGVSVVLHPPSLPRVRSLLGHPFSVIRREHAVGTSLSPQDLLVRKTPPITMAAPKIRASVIASPNIIAPRVIAQMGTKLTKMAVLEGPIDLMPW